MKQRRIGIIGAGISGLSGAYYLRQGAQAHGLDLQIDLWEQSNRLGGVIRTEKVQGFLLEWGPENFIAFKPAALELAKKLGLGDELIGSNDEQRQTYVIDSGKIQPLPDGMAFLAPVDFRSFWSSPLISRRGKLRAMLEPFILRSRGDLTAREFLQRRLGREMTEKVAEPLVSAIYGGDVNRLSISSALPDTYRMEQKWGSLWRGSRHTRSRNGSRRGSLPFFMSLRGGMSLLVRNLERELEECNARKGVSGIRLETVGERYVIRAPGQEESYDAVLVCTPAPPAAEILEKVSPIAAGLLREIGYTSTSLVYLGYRRSEFSHPLNGFGFVTPERESDVLDACTWVSTKFENRSPADHVLLRCAVHDGRRERPAVTEEQLIAAAHGEVSRLMHIHCQPVLSRVSHARQAMPQLTVGHVPRLRQIDEEIRRLPGLRLASAYNSGIGVPDCIRGARQAAESLISRFTEGF